jgi:hypothetical protein
MALIATALAKQQAMGLYHVHIIFHTVSLVRASNVVALVLYTIVSSLSRRDSKI